MTRIGLVLLPLLLLEGCSAAREEPEAKPLVAVEAATAEIADVQGSVRAPALIHPRQQAGVTARITATIVELLARKGDRVAAGAVLARLDNRDLMAQRDETLATLRQAEGLAERRGHLFEEGAIPQRDLLTAQTELVQAKARLEQIGVQVTFSELRSPFAGVITEQFLYAGDLAQPSTPVFTVADTGTAVARAQVPEGDATTIRSGQACSFAPAGSEGEGFKGHITVINPAVESARGAIEAWCEIPNGDGGLLPGVFGDLKIFTTLAVKSVVVPAAAVQFVEGTSKGTVSVIDAQKVAHHKDVTTGLVFDDKVQILEGLAGGETVITKGGYALADGTAVHIGGSAEDKEKDEK